MSTGLLLFGLDLFILFHTLRTLISGRYKYAHLPVYWKTITILFCLGVTLKLVAVFMMMPMEMRETLYTISLILIVIGGLLLSYYFYLVTRYRLKPRYPTNTRQ